MANWIRAHTGFVVMFIGVVFLLCLLTMETMEIDSTPDFRFVLLFFGVVSFISGGIVVLVFIR